MVMAKETSLPCLPARSFVACSSVERPGTLAGELEKLITKSELGTL